MSMAWRSGCDRHPVRSSDAATRCHQTGRRGSRCGGESDVTLGINNAGIAQPSGFLAADSEATARRIFETNFFAMLRVSQAFAPILKGNGGGALLNVLSVTSWVIGGELAACSASNSAAWSLTNALRSELAAQKTCVLALIRLRGDGHDFAPTQAK